MIPAASVIVPTFNRAGLLRHTLPRLLGQALPQDTWEVLLADDGSADETPAVAAELAAPALRYLRLAHGGRAVTRNAAIAAARGRYLVFVDDDELVGPDFVEQHLRVHRRHPGAAVAGAIVRVDRPEALLPPPARLRGYHRNPFPSGNVSLERREAVAAGGFDPAFDRYGWEDSEFFRRLANRGIVSRYSWRAPIYHIKPQNTRSLRRCLEREQERGAMGALFYRRHPCFTVAWATKTWGPIRSFDAVLDLLFGLEAAQAAILRGVRRDCPPSWRHRLLIMHAEISTAARELTRPPAQ